MLSIDKQTKNGRPIAKIINKETGKTKEYVYVDEDYEKGESIINLTKNYKFIPLASDRVTYLAAPSGCGKSYLVGQMLKEIRKKDKDIPIFIFSPFEEDKSLDQASGLEYIKCDETLLNEPIDVQKSFVNCVVVFDDIESVDNLRVVKKLRELRDQTLEIGRHFNTKVIATNHLISDYKNTRKLLNESQAVIIYPKGNSYHNKKYLKHHCGLDDKQCNQILNCNSRYLFIHKTHPQYFITEQSIFLLS